MHSLPSVFKQCSPRREVLASELPDSIFAADLWDVVCRKPGTHPDYLDPLRFFASTHPTENLKLLVKDSIFAADLWDAGERCHNFFAQFGRVFRRFDRKA